MSYSRLGFRTTMPLLCRGIIVNTQLSFPSVCNLRTRVDSSQILRSFIGSMTQEQLLCNVPNWSSFPAQLLKAGEQLYRFQGSHMVT